MTISEIKINEYFKTCSGELFKLLFNPKRGNRKDYRYVVRCDSGEIFTEKEFEKMMLFKNIEDEIS